MQTRPYYRASKPVQQRFENFNSDRIDLTSAHLDSYPPWDPSGTLPDLRDPANSLFDARAAAAIRCSVGDPASVRLTPIPGVTGMTFDPKALLEFKTYSGEAADVFICTQKILAVMAFKDYFPDAPRAQDIRDMVSQAILQAGPGWCGTYGPVSGDQGQTEGFEGNYDFAQMFILPLVYRYFDYLTSAASDQAITLLLARGRMHRPNKGDTVTSGQAPIDWSSAGSATFGPLPSVISIPETENHVLGIATARYLTNQLLYQRTGELQYDNRRNGFGLLSPPTCMQQVLGLLRNYLRDGFAEYNAKNYQEETRHALLNLHSYAYDAEVRLGARMVLDQISAHVAVSSNDLRRMVPFRRRNEGINVNLLPNVNPLDTSPGFMDVSLLDAHGADPMAAHFALLAGNTRAYEYPNERMWPGEGAARPWSYAITPNFNSELTLDAISDYRLPPSIHDLFVNDLHRRFYQRLHRHPLEELGGQRNCENMEIYAGSPSYLISAGGKPATWVIPGAVWQGYQAQNIGVAVPISFMPTGQSAHIPPRSGSGGTNDAAELIQLMHFSDDFPGKLIQSMQFSEEFPAYLKHGGTVNYGVAPDFACGVFCHLPDWIRTEVPPNGDGVFFVDRRRTGYDLAGFYLAIIKAGSFIVLEAFDTWLHPEVTLDQFRAHVDASNSGIQFVSGQESVYVTYFGNRIHFVVWTQVEFDNHVFGSKILNIEYAAGNRNDTLAEAGNDTDPSRFLSGNILNSTSDGATEIRNPALGSVLRLDWTNPEHLLRQAEDGSLQQAGRNSAGQLFEVWVDFGWDGPSEGDFYRPFKTLAAAVEAVADGGVVRIVPGVSGDRTAIRHAGKACRIVAPYGVVGLGVF